MFGKNSIFIQLLMSLKLKNLTITFDDKSLFPVLNLMVNKGEVSTIMGPSGCGKSTLLAAISGSLSHIFTVTGDIVLNNLSIMNLPLEKRQVGILFQDDLLFPHMDVFGNLAFSLPASMSKENKQEHIHSSLTDAGLSGFADRDVATLSGGQRARISLLRTLLAKPEAVLLDEPFSKLDQELRASFRDFVYQQVQLLNIPALLVTHNRQDSLSGQVIDLTSPFEAQLTC